MEDGFLMPDVANGNVDTKGAHDIQWLGPRLPSLMSTLLLRMSARSWASSAHADVNSFSSRSALPLWHDVAEFFDVNSLLRRLAALAKARSADVSSSLRCLLRCLDACTARRRGC